MRQSHRQEQNFIFSQIMAQRLSILQMNGAKLDLIIGEAAKKNPLIDSSKLALPWRKPFHSKLPEIIEENFASEYRLYDTLKEDLLPYWEEGDAELLYLITGSLDEFGFLGMDGCKLCEDTPFNGKRTEFLRTKIMESSIPGLAAKGAQEYYVYASKETFGKDSLAFKTALYLKTLQKKASPSTIAAAVKVSEKEITKALLQLKNLPSSPLGKEAKAAVPDFKVTINEDRLTVSPVRHTKVGVKLDDISGYSTEEMQNFRKETQLLMDAVSAREEALQRHTEALILARSDFFLKKDSTSIVGLKDIAAITGRHISTVSRALKGRYFLFEGVIYPFSVLWSHTVGGKSHKNIENNLKKILDGEDKTQPLSDEIITGILKKQGFAIARRTIAKYREKLGYPSMHQRKKNNIR